MTGMPIYAEVKWEYIRKAVIVWMKSYNSHERLLRIFPRGHRESSLPLPNATRFEANCEPHTTGANGGREDGRVNPRLAVSLGAWFSRCATADGVLSANAG